MFISNSYNSSNKYKGRKWSSKINYNMQLSNIDKISVKKRINGFIENLNF